MTTCSRADGHAWFNYTFLTSKERDIETGLDYFGARYYGNTQGRFTTPDPFQASGRVGKPQSWNRYSYVLNNPLRLVDRDGLKDNDDLDEQEAKRRLAEEPTHGAIVESAPVREVVPTPVATVVMTGPIITPLAFIDEPSTDSSANGQALISELHARAVPMKQMLEVGAVIATAEIALPVVAMSAGGAAMTTLGIEAAPLDTAVIGSLANTAPYAGQVGYNTLEVVGKFEWTVS